MLEIVINILGISIISLTGIYVWSKLLNEKINFKNWKIYAALIVSVTVLYFNYNSFLKFTISTILFSIIIKILFRRNLLDCVITATFTQIINALSELIFAIVAIFILKIDLQIESVSIWIILFIDFFVSLSNFILVNFKSIRNIHKLIIKLLSKLKTKHILFGILAITFISNVYLELTFYKVDTLIVFLLNNTTVYIVVIIILLLAKKENEYTKIYDKYNTTINSLKEYEDILDKYRVSNHENKNDLLTIRNMIVEKNKKTVQYIDKLVKNKIKDDEKIMQEVSVIPAGGLRGLIYSKILYMKEENIEYELNISKEIRTVDLINNLDDFDLLDICHIIGVYIDNAIEAVIELKDKYINIDMYLENNNMIFEISNYYKGKIDLEKIEESGYTTKSNGHGYGLSLTKEIINKNKKLKNEKRLSKEIFTQILKINMK